MREEKPRNHNVKAINKLIEMQNALLTWMMRPENKDIAEIFAKLQEAKRNGGS